MAKVKLKKPLAGGLLAGAMTLQAFVIPAAGAAAAQAPVSASAIPSPAFTAASEIPDAPIQKITAGKARYAPGEQVEFTLQFDQSEDWSGILELEFYQLNRLVGKESRKVTVLKEGTSDLTVAYKPPSTDFRGYLVKAYIKGKPDAYKTAALDVSSSWTRFPRYGYVTEFPKETAAQSDAKLKQLSQEYYLNGYQFYDWMWRHDVSVYSQTDENGLPLKDAEGNFITAPIDANTSYSDLLGRKLYPLSVKQQVAAAQKYGSAAMAYQMNYAAREHYEDFGVKREWGLYNKNAAFPNPDPVKYQNGFYFDWVNPPTALYLQDPGNPEWQSYITKEFNRSVNEFGFDGIHLDQWGASDSDFLYDYFGNQRYYSKDYDSLINSVKDALTDNNPAQNYVTFNMVGGNGGYADVPNPDTKTDFDYSEIWQDKDRYRDLLQVVDDTREKDGGKAMVIAAYMNYKQAAGDHYEASEVTGVPRTVQFLSRINKVPGWVGDFGKKDEDKIVWHVNVEEAGTYDLSLLYGHDNGGGSPEGRLTVNGTVADSAISFSEKTGWGNPVAEAAVQAELVEGDNEITLQLNTSDLWLNVDSLNISGNGVNQVYEAEYAELISCKVDKYGHVYYFETDGDYITFDVNVPADGTYPVAFGYGIESTPVVRDIWVNDTLEKEAATFGATGSWENFKEKTVNLPLHAGANTITLKVSGVSDSGMKVDDLRIGDVRYEAEKARIGWKPTKEALIQKQAGTSAATYVKNIKNAADYVEFDVTAAQPGTYRVAFQYATSNNPTGNISVNGEVYAEDVTLPSTGGWGFEGKWGWKTVDLPLEAGVNAVKLSLTSSGQYLNLNGLLIEPAVIPIDDAQHVSVQGGVQVSSSAENAKTDNFNGDPAKSVTFTVDAAEAGEYTLGFSYRTGNNVNGQVSVNGTDYSVALDSNDWYSDGSWWGTKEFKAALQQGSNTVTLKLESADTWLNLHGLYVATKLEAEAPEVRVNGVTKGDQWTDDFGQNGDSLTFVSEQAEAGTVPVAFVYNAEETGVYQLDVNGAIIPVTFAATEGSWQEKTVDVSLQQGSNSLKLVPAYNQAGSIKLDQLKIGDAVTEAEDGSRTGNAVVEAAAGEVGYAYDFKQQGDLLSLVTGPAETDGAYDLTVYYRNQGPETKRSVYVNGKKAGSVTLETSEDWNEAVIPVYLSSKSDENTITLKMEEATTSTGIDIDRLTVNGVTLEAEAAETGWEPVVPKTGGISVEFGKTDNHGRAGQTVIFNVDLKQDASELVFKYRSGNNPTFDVLVDGQLVADDATFGATSGGWGGGMVEKGMKASLSAGEHTVELVMVSEGQYVNLDSLTVGGKEYEVEDADFASEGNGIEVSAGYAADFKDEGDFLTFDIEAAASGPADLTWVYKNDAASKRTAVRAIYVNDVKLEDADFLYTGNEWSSLTTSGVMLHAGANRITIKVEDRDDDGIKLDFLQAGAARYHAEKANFVPPMNIYKNMLLNFGHAGDEVNFTVNVEQAGETSLVFTYANAGSVSTKALYVDGQPVIGGDGKPVRIWFDGTGNRDKFNEDVYYVMPYMSKGAHTVTLKHELGDKGSIDLRKLTLGFFDEPSIRLMDAGLAAMGATHIELGTAEKFEEGPNMLAHEYYPNRSKKMKESLKESMKDYYKFFTAYENVLFDSKEDKGVQTAVSKQNGGTLAVSNDGSPDTIWSIARKNDQNPGFERYDIIHLINLLNNDDNWRNAAAEPEKLQNLKVTYPIGITAKDAPKLKVYAASPDHDGGLLQELEFSWKGSALEIELPELFYWEMLVVDRDGTGLVIGQGNGSTTTPASGSEGNANSGTGTDTTAGNGSETANGAQESVIVNENSLKDTLDGKFAVELDNSQKQVLLPGDAVQVYLSDKLEVNKGDLNLSIPADLLKKALELAPDAGDVQLAVSVEKVDQDQAEALTKPKDGSNTQIHTVGGILEFNIQVLKGDQVLGSVSQFDQPVELGISYSGADVKENLLGIYYYNETAGAWEYVGGTVDKAGKKVVAQLNHFSKYALMEVVKTFDDVASGHWAEQAVQTLAAKQIVTGKDGNAFDPQGNTTRAEFAAFLVRALGLQPAGGTPFEDVDSSAWYAGVVSAAFQAGLISGKTDTSFAPNEAISREEMAAMIVRALEYKSGTTLAGNGAEFADAAEISAWAKEAVSKAVSLGLMQGPGEGRFAPSALATRAETAQVIYNLLQK